MTASKLRAVTTAFLLGAATVCGAALVLSSPAAAAVSAKVGKPLLEAQQLIAKGDYKAAMTKVNEAEAIAGKSAEENKIIAQMKDAIAVKTGDHEETGRRRHVFDAGGIIRRDVEAGLESGSKLAEVRVQAEARIGAVRRFGGDLDGGGSDQSLNLAHRRQQAALLGGVEGLQDRCREIV